MTNRGRILVVDDDQELRETLREYFEITGFVVYAVADGEGMRKVIAEMFELPLGLANEWAQYGIRVNAIAPGVFPTDLNRNLIQGTPRGEWFVKHTPLARFGDVEELVAAAIYLISPGASFTTGETLVVDGGFLVKGV